MLPKIRNSMNLDLYVRFFVQTAEFLKKIINVQYQIRACRMEKILEINKRACMAIRQLRVLIHLSFKLFNKTFCQNVFDEKQVCIYTFFYWKLQSKNKAVLDKKVSLTELSTYICQEGKFDWHRMRKKNDFLVRQNS